MANSLEVAYYTYIYAKVRLITLKPEQALVMLNQGCML